MYVSSIPTDLRECAARLRGDEPGDPSHPTRGLKAQMLSTADLVEESNAELNEAFFFEWFAASAELQHKELAGAALLTRCRSLSGDVSPNIVDDTLDSFTHAATVLLWGTVGILLLAGVVLARKVVS